MANETAASHARGAEAAEPKGAGAFGPRNAEATRSRGAGAAEPRGAEAAGSRDAGAAGPRGAEAFGPRGAGAAEPRGAEAAGSRDAGAAGPRGAEAADRNDAPRCEFLHAHPDAIERVRTLLPDEEHLIDLAELFRVFGDSTRIKILYALFESELCVCDIAALLGMSISAISHQLRILRTAKLVDYRRVGKTVFYALADDHVRTVLGQGMEHVLE